MQYKTIALALLEQDPVIHDQLVKNRTLRRTMNAYASVLKHKHQAWIEVLRPTRLEFSPTQISSEALELALEDLQVTLRREFPTDESEPSSIDKTMAFLRLHTPPA